MYHHPGVQVEDPKVFAQANVAGGDTLNIQDIVALIQIVLF